MFLGMFLSLHAVAISVASATEQSLTSYVIADVEEKCKPSCYYISVYMHIYICNNLHSYHLACCQLQETVMSWIMVNKILACIALTHSVTHSPSHSLTHSSTEGSVPLET